MVVVWDVSKRDQRLRSIAAILVQFGKLDILGNNAGISGNSEPEHRGLRPADGHQC